jgi:hypothetical protein
MTEPDSKWIEKIEKLMRLAEDPATSESERENLVAKVTHLMVKYGIEQDMLNFQQERPVTAERRTFRVTDTYAKKKLNILHVISRAFGCVMVQQRDGTSGDVFGTREDIERVYMLYASVIIQLQGALAHAQVYKPTWEHGRAFNNSFVTGFTLTVTQRIFEAAARAKKDVQTETQGTGMELVLVNKAQVVANAVHNFYPRLQNVNTSMRSTSEAGYGAGRAAGQRADIGGSRISSRHADRKAIG